MSSPSLVALLALVLVPPGCFTVVEPPAPFRGLELVLDPGPQAILHADLRGDGRTELLAISAGGRLRAHALAATTLDATWELELGGDVAVVDVLRGRGPDRLLAYGDGVLSVLDPAAGTLRELVRAPCVIGPAPDAGVAHVDITRDLNGDGRDDLLLPAADGLHVLVQEPDGRFAPAVVLGPGVHPQQVVSRCDVWGLARVHALDYDGDGRVDLVSWADDRFEVHLQDAQGRFVARATTFTTGVTFDSDRPRFLVAPEGLRERKLDTLPPGVLAGRVLRSLQDMDGDGVSDLVVFELMGDDYWDLESRLEVHRGARIGGRTVYASEPTSVLHRDGLPFELRLIDLERDGGVDVLLTSLDPGPLAVLGMLFDALVHDTLALDLGVYRLDDGAYPEEPSERFELVVHTPGEAGQRGKHFPPLLIGDVNGDGRDDLLVGVSGEERLTLRLGLPGPALFAEEAIGIEVRLPDEDHAWLADLDGDGRADVVLHHVGGVDDPAGVTVLLAR